jgi:hypothetical protein
MAFCIPPAERCKLTNQSDGTNLLVMIVSFPALNFLSSAMVLSSDVHSFSFYLTMKKFLRYLM